MDGAAAALTAGSSGLSSEAAGASSSREISSRRPAILTIFSVWNTLGRHAGQQVDRAVVVEDLDPPDGTAFHPGLVGDRPDDVRRPDLMGMADFDPERLHRSPSRPSP